MNTNAGSDHIYTATDFGSKDGDFTAVAQFKVNNDGSYTMLNVKQYRANMPIRSKAQVKRLLKRFESYSPILDLIYCRGTKTRRKIRPVSWQEIVAHNIKVGV